MNVRVNLIAPYWINTPLVQSVLPALEESGAKLSWTSIDFVVDAMVRSATDESAGGKAWGIWPEGYSDFQDDEAGGWGGDHLREHFKIQRAQGDKLI
jgi:NAD(P)-dependent dehydrogenase (short-subunit alcohol dehydrogenase family)